MYRLTSRCFAVAAAAALLLWSVGCDPETSNDTGTNPPPQNDTATEPTDAVVDADTTDDDGGDTTDDPTDADDGGDVPTDTPVDGDADEPTDAADTTDAADIDTYVPPPDVPQIDTAGRDAFLDDALVQPDTGAPDTSSDAGPPETCCMPDDSCSVVNRQQCLNQGGQIAPNAASCSSVNCATHVAPSTCCTNLQCSLKTESDCWASGGTPRIQQSCQNTSCSGAIPTACCISQMGQNGCLELTPRDCRLLGGNSQMASSCGSATCGGKQMGACCFNNQCRGTSRPSCKKAGGNYFPNKGCSDTPCP